MDQSSIEVVFDQDNFLTTWQTAFREAGRQTRFRNEGWQGPIAHEQLDRLGLLNIARLEPVSEPSELQRLRLRWKLREFAFVAESYRTGAENVEIAQVARDSRINPLSTAKKALQKVMDREYRPPAVRLMTAVVKWLEDEISRIEDEIEDETWNLGILLRRAELRLIAPGARRAIDLEARFQLRVAYLLMNYFHSYKPTAASNLPFVNISRLVILFYIAAQLANKQNGSLELICTRTGAPLTVKSVEQNLTRAGLHKWRWNRKRRCLRPPRELKRKRTDHKSSAQ